MAIDYSAHALEEVGGQEEGEEIGEGLEVGVAEDFAVNSGIVAHKRKFSMAN